MRSKYLTASFAIAFTVLSACSAKYRSEYIDGSKTQLDPAQTVLIAVATDGGYGSTPGFGSGQFTTKQTALAFAKHAKQVEIADAKLHGRDELLMAARNTGAGYLVIPTVASWEHRATEWSGRRSHASIGMVVIAVPTGEQISAVLLDGFSRKMTLTSTSPESVTPHLIGGYVNRLYAGKDAAQGEQ